MKALTIHPYYAEAIAAGAKTIECRTWSTDYRGDLLICSSSKKFHGTIPGHALAVVKLVDVRPFTKKDLAAALMLPAEFKPGCFAWVLADNRIIKPVPVKGKLSLFECGAPIEYIPFEKWVLPDGADDSQPAQWFIDNWNPLRF